MNLDLLQNAISEMKTNLETAIVTASYNGQAYPNGLQAKEALIRSQNLILKVHEVVKVSLLNEISHHRTDFSIYPPVGLRNPEMTVYGLLKGKKQDIVIMFNNLIDTRTQIAEGPLAGFYDPVGTEKAENSIVVAIRSQLSSVAKNFDTLMERAFAETLNLRLRLPDLIMGDVYVLPVMEYDDVLMKINQVGWKRTPVHKFISTFLAISNRAAIKADPEIYKYERVALVLADFRENPPKIILSTEELKAGGFIPNSFPLLYEPLSPKNFAQDLYHMYRERHGT